jgi:carbamoyltransferase
MSEYILGLHYGHDATAVLIKDGKVVEAMSEERLSRAKKHVGFPHLSVGYIQKKYGIEEFKHVVIVGENPSWDGYIFVTQEENIAGRKNPPKTKDYLRSLGARFPFIGFMYKVRDRLLYWRTRKDIGPKVEAFLKEKFPKATIQRVSHHLAHAWASVPFMDSKDEKHLILTLDGAGDNISGSINMYEHGKVTRLHTVSISASIGLLYCAVVDILGMTRNEHEFKVMGLAPYAKATSGEKVYEKLKKLVWFDKKQMTFVSSIPLEQATAHLIANDYHQHRFDSLAYGVQKLTEESVKDMARAAIEKYGVKNIALGGGVFMNVKANQYLLDLPEIDVLTVVPSCGDESLALGAAVYGYAVLHDNDVSSLEKIENLYLGSSYEDTQIKEVVDTYSFATPCSVEYFNPQGEVTIEKKIAQLLAENSVVGRLKGRAEWGARALGNRSILANPTSRDNVKLINEMIKGRDFWMPFATSMLYEVREEYLDVPKNFFAPYMSITFNTKPKAHTELIAALHPYDLTSRPQMVTKEMNPQYHALISEFKNLTGSGGILNTSFNLHGEPNVESPIDALRTFDLSGLPHVAVGNYLISKNK